MELSEFFPFWNQLSEQEQQTLSRAAVPRTVQKGVILHNGSADCVGLIALQSGQLRAFITSEEGREITLYRLLERDLCLFSAACMLQSIQFDISIVAEKDSVMWIIPAPVYQSLMQASAPVANYTNQLMATRFSEVMWLMEQILWKSQDKRLAAFLLEEDALEHGQPLHITHETIANHLGTAREVVTRLLRYFQSEGMVSLSRGVIRLLDREQLERLLL